MALSGLSSPTAVKLAIAECDRLGRDEFLRSYGFGAAREYLLRYQGSEYDSKAIAGVAHGYQFAEAGPLTRIQFSGGIGPDGAATRLSKLGFEIDGISRRVNEWSLLQCEVAADGYFECLRHKIAKEAFNRSAVLERVANEIGRSHDSVDYKFQNIDYILFNAELPRLGNAVARNVQALLGFVVLDPLARRMEVLDAVSDRASPSSNADVFVPVPTFEGSGIEGSSDVAALRGHHIDFAKRDAQNKLIGRVGEAWVLALEKRTLISAGRADLADKVAWISEVQGDGLGYDIQSFDLQGNPVFIEVKTTNQGIHAPFYISQTELAVSEQRGEAYMLYRVFNLADGPQIYKVGGSLRNKLHLLAQVFLAHPIGQS